MRQRSFADYKRKYGTNMMKVRPSNMFTPTPPSFFWWLYAYRGSQEGVFVVMQSDKFKAQINAISGHGSVHFNF